MEAKIARVVPFLKVSSMERSVRYYVDGLGFTIEKRWDVGGELRWCWLEAAGAALMLQQFPTEGEDSWRPQGKVGEGVSLVFICEDAVELYRRIRARGIEASEPRVGNGFWVTALSDPDDYRLEFESPTDVAEDTALSEVGAGSISQ